MADAVGNGRPTRERLRPGDLLAERYRLEAVLGSGSSGIVWRARHVHLETECAVKLFEPPPGANPQEASARFLQEARVMARLKCTNVAQVFDYGVHEQMPFLVLELLLGSSLAARLGELRAQGCRLSAAETVSIIRDVAEGLSAAHAVQVVHRDLKPENIFLTRDGSGHVAKVLDFGIAKWSAEGAPRVTTTRTVMGTPYYMSPEQFAGALDVDHRSDVWSLGVIAFECLTGQLPFQGESFLDIAFRVCKQGPLIASQLAEVPAGFDAWFARATALHPEYRFASARELANGLALACAAPVTPQPALPALTSATGAERANSGARHEHRWAVAVAVGAALVCGTLWLWWSPTQTPRRELQPPAPTATVEAQPSPPTPIPTTARAELLPEERASTPTVKVLRDDTAPAKEEHVAASPPAAKPPEPKARPPRPPAAPSSRKIRAPPVPPDPSTPKPECRQPFWIDEKGIRRLKMACL